VNILLFVNDLGWRRGQISGKYETWPTPPTPNTDL
jgi:hypothetical protein